MLSTDLYLIDADVISIAIATNIERIITKLPINNCFLFLKPKTQNDNRPNNTAIKAPLENVKPIDKETSINASIDSFDLSLINEYKAINKNGNRLFAKNWGSAANKLILGKPNTAPVQFLHKIPKSSVVNELITNCNIAKIEKIIALISAYLKIFL